MLSLVLYVVAVGTNTRLHVMKGMDGPAFARQLSRDDSLFESGPASVPVPVGHVVSAPQSLIQSEGHPLAQYGLCDSNFRGINEVEFAPAGWSKSNRSYTSSDSPYKILDGSYPCTNASFPICGDAQGKGMFALYLGTAAWRSGGGQDNPWGKFGKCRAGAQFTRGLMDASRDLKWSPAECGTILQTCRNDYIQAVQESAGCAENPDLCKNMDEAAIAASAAAAHASITAMDSQCMAKESHLAAMASHISQVSLAMSDVAKEIKWRMSENNVSIAANWRFVVGNASKIAGKLDEIFQRGKVLEDRAPSKAISAWAQYIGLSAAPDSYVGSLDAFCEKLKNIATTAVAGENQNVKNILYASTDLLQMINALEMTVREVHCIAPKCVDGEYVVQPAPSAGWNEFQAFQAAIAAPSF